MTNPRTTLPCGCVHATDHWVRLCPECETLWQALHVAAAESHRDPEAAWQAVLAAGTTKEDYRTP